MEKTARSLLGFAFVLFTCGDALAEVWVNNAPNALVKRIEIFTSSSVIVVDNPLLPTQSYVNITFQNDVTYPGLPLHPTTGSVSPSFLFAVDNAYTAYTVYYCQSGGAPVNETCDGIALRLQNGQLCAGFFQYSTLVERIATIADIGCFILVEIVKPPRLISRDFLQKYTKDQLIEILTGAKPISPVGPVCLTCPPWNNYANDIDLKLKGLQIKKYKIEVKEIK